MKRLIMLALAALSVLAVAATPAYAAQKGGKAKSYTYEITVENLTDTQPLSPPLAVIHKRGFKVWKRGAIASHGVAAIAEDANNSVLESALAKIRRVMSVETVAQDPIAPGEIATFAVTTKGRYNRLSLITMGVQTNDMFTGTSSLRLHRIAGMRMLNTRGWDAGSEANNQLKSHIPGPCCGNGMVRDPEGDVIRPHPGIQAGVGDADVAKLGWTGPVAKWTIKRVAN